MGEGTERKSNRGSHVGATEGIKRATGKKDFIVAQGPRR